MEVKVTKLEKVTIDTEHVSQETKWKMKAEASSGYPKIQITQLEPFGGITRGEWITIKVDQPQTTLDIKDPESNAEEHKKAMVDGLKKKPVKKTKKGKK